MFNVGLLLPTTPNVSNVAAVSSLFFTAEMPNLRSAVIQQFNLQVEQQFGPNVLTIGYVGNMGKRLPETINDVNVPKPFNPNLPASATNGINTRPLANTLSILNGVGYLASEGIQITTRCKHRSNAVSARISHSTQTTHGAKR